MAGDRGRGPSGGSSRVGPPGQHGGALLASLLAEHGVRHVFGVPGGQTLALYDAILDRGPDLRHVLVRDERSAAYAADGYARVTGRAGVCDATVGPGAAKLPSGLAEALGPASDRAAGEAAHALFRRPDVYPVMRDFHDVAETGWYGRPELATPERAEEIAVAVADHVVRQAREIWDALGSRQEGR